MFSRSQRASEYGFLTRIFSGSQRGSIRVLLRLQVKGPQIAFQPFGASYFFLEISGLKRFILAQDFFRESAKLKTRPTFRARGKQAFSQNPTSQKSRESRALQTWEFQNRSKISFSQIPGKTRSRSNPISRKSWGYPRIRSGHFRLVRFVQGVSEPSNVAEAPRLKSLAVWFLFSGSQRSSKRVLLTAQQGSKRVLRSARFAEAPAEGASSCFFGGLGCFFRESAALRSVFLRLKIFFQGCK